MSRDELEEHWPAADDRLFVETRTWLGGTVAIDPRERLWRMVNGYRTGADALVDEVALAPHRGRDLIYPVVFLYRHSLELHLKQILADYGDQAGVAADFKDHRLDRLWQKCQRTLVYFFPNEDRETLKVVDALVDEFMAIDERSVVFRYSTDTRGLELPLPLTDPDLHALRRSVAAVANFLECCEWAMHERCTAC